MEIRSLTRSHWTKIKVSKGCIPSAGSRGGSVSFTFLVSRGWKALSLAHGPLLHLQSQRSWASPSPATPSLVLLLLPPSSTFKDSCDDIGLT